MVKVYEINGVTPVVHPSAYVHPSAVLIGDVIVGPGEFIIVPHGTEHCPEALDGECHVLLLEPGSTRNTGTVETDKTRHRLERIG